MHAALLLHYGLGWNGAKFIIGGGRITCKFFVVSKEICISFKIWSIAKFKSSFHQLVSEAMSTIASLYKKKLKEMEWNYKTHLKKTRSAVWIFKRISKNFFLRELLRLLLRGRTSFKVQSMIAPTLLTALLLDKWSRIKSLFSRIFLADALTSV